MKITIKREQRRASSSLSNVSNLRDKGAKRRILLAAALMGAVAFTSCNVNDEISDNVAVSFTAGIDQAAAVDGTRAAGTTWGNDAIGIFMMNGATTEAVNMQYTTTGSSSFTVAAGNEMYYPMDGSTVNFIAYYPYASGTALATPLGVTIGTSQTAASQPAFDLLWAKADNGGSGYNKVSHKTTPVALTFVHKLAKIVMNCTADPSVGSALTGMTVTIKGMNTENTFNLSTGTLGNSPDTPLPITPRTVTDGSVYDAIIMPDSYAAEDNITVEFTVSGETFTWDVGATNFDGGNEYSYDVILTRTGVSVTGTISPWIPNDMGGVDAE